MFLYVIPNCSPIDPALTFLFAMPNCNSIDAALSASMFYLIVALWMLVFLIFLVAICVTKCFVDDGSIAGIQLLRL